MVKQIISNIASSDFFRKLNPNHPVSFFKRFSTLKDFFERNPNNQFITLLNALGRLENVLNGTVTYFHRHRNHLWFKLFFREPELYELVKKEIEYQYNNHPLVKLIITPRGVMIFDNYKKMLQEIDELTYVNYKPGLYNPYEISDSLIFVGEAPIGEVEAENLEGFRTLD